MTVGAVEGPVRIALVVASTRSEGRFADVVLAWLQPSLQREEGLAVDLVDLRDHAMPRYDLAAPPARAFRIYETAEQRVLGNGSMPQTGSWCSSTSSITATRRR